MAEVSDELKERIAVHGPVPTTGYDAEGRCTECRGLWPGHRIDCRTDNERARKYQAALPTRFKGKRTK